MIPRPFIAQWKDHAPWRSNEQIEQDLIISRALVEIFSDEFLKENLAFRGGTALHKLYLNPAPRYSEDIDLVQIEAGPIGPILQRLDEVMSFFEEQRSVRQKANSNTILYRFASEYSPEIRLRLKVEINCREHFNVLGLTNFPFEVKNEWFTGTADLTTYDPNELLGSKLRALYQRKKGRDLFDLHYADQHLELDYDKLIRCYQEYMASVVNKPPTQRQYLQNINEKRTDADFVGDLEALLRPEITYDQEQAFDWLINNIIKKF